MSLIFKLELSIKLIRGSLDIFISPADKTDGPRFQSKTWSPERGRQFVIYYYNILSLSLVSLLHMWQRAYSDLYWNLPRCSTWHGRVVVSPTTTRNGWLVVVNFGFVELTLLLATAKEIAKIKLFAVSNYY